MYLRAQLSERELSRVRVGAPATVAVDAAGGEPVAAPVSEILPSANEGNLTFTVKIRSPIRRGSSRTACSGARRSPPNGGGGWWSMPREAVVTQAGQTVAFVVEKDKARAVPVTLGLEEDDRVEVTQRAARGRPGRGAGAGQPDRRRTGFRESGRGPLMFLSAFSIRRPVAIAMVILALVVIGVVGYTRPGDGPDPQHGHALRDGSVVYPGAGPREVETEVTKPLEDAVATVSGVKHINSYSSEGVSVGGDRVPGGGEIPTWRPRTCATRWRWRAARCPTTRRSR